MGEQNNFCNRACWQNRPTNPQIQGGNNRLNICKIDSCQCLCGRRQREAMRCLMALKNKREKIAHMFSLRSKTRQYETVAFLKLESILPNLIVDNYKGPTVKYEKDWSSLGDKNCHHQTTTIPFLKRELHTKEKLPEMKSKVSRNLDNKDKWKRCSK